MEQDRGNPTPKQEKGKSLGQRWADMQPTKTVLFWSCLITAVVVMIIGFNWGGWMTTGTAEDMSEDMAEDAVVSRLAPMCVVQFLLDPAKAEKLVELKDMSTYSRGSYIEKQGWATIPGEEEPDSDVAEECVNRLMKINQ